MPERLECWEKCPFRDTSIKRPCAREIYRDNSVCEQNIQSDPHLARYKPFKIDHTVDNYLNGKVTISANGRVIATLNDGIITKSRS